MTDAEINLAIAEIEYPDAMRYEVTEQSIVRVYIDYPRYVVKNYVNNWYDIGPIIERKNIALSPVVDEHPHYGPSFTGEWIAEHILGSNLETCESYAETPTKAAALCYLKMKGDE